MAASVTQLGLCARLIAPVLGAAALGGGLRVDLAEAWWTPPPGGPFGLSLPRTAAAADGGGELLAVLAGPVSALTGATASMSVSAQVLWGNVASAVNGAAAMIAVARPELAPAAATAAGAMLSFPALAGSYQGRVATAGLPSPQLLPHLPAGPAGRGRRLRGLRAAAARLAADSRLAAAGLVAPGGQRHEHDQQQRRPAERGDDRVL